MKIADDRFSVASFSTTLERAVNTRYVTRQNLTPTTDPGPFLRDLAVEMVLELEHWFHTTAAEPRFVPATWWQAWKLEVAHIWLSCIPWLGARLTAWLRRGSKVETIPTKYLCPHLPTDRQQRHVKFLWAGE